MASHKTWPNLPALKPDRQAPPEREIHNAMSVRGRAARETANITRQKPGINAGAQGSHQKPAASTPANGGKTNGAETTGQLRNQGSPVEAPGMRNFTSGKDAAPERTEAAPPNRGAKPVRSSSLMTHVAHGMSEGRGRKVQVKSA